MYHIYNTMANSTEYVRYNLDAPKGINVAMQSVLIKGGSGINRQHMRTPLGIHTAITDEDYEWLKDDPHFKEHIKNGYIVVRKSESHPEIIAADMATRQWVKGPNGNTIPGDSFPVSPEDFSGESEKEGLTAIEPKTNKKTKAA